LPETASAAARLAAIGELELGVAGELRGTVTRVGDGVAHVAGLTEVGHEELVSFDSGALGMAYDLAPDYTGIVLLSDASSVKAGDGVLRSGHTPSLPVSDALFGRVVDPIGRVLDDAGSSISAQPWPVFHDAPSLIARAPVTRPLRTGVQIIDTAVPVGLGQRQLIIGDRNVGKTALALDIVAAQRDTGVLCVYVLIGQPISRVLAIREALAKNRALGHTVVVAADAAESAGLQYLAPYAGASVAEYFRGQGRDVVVVYDDLTKHADAYRELALLLGRPPGREAFPGDIFFVHAELLERATALNEVAGGGSVTALPLVETTDSDISGYIPTNLISITDGQIYLDTGRFERNLRPAVDVSRSVSRIGGAAQSGAMRKAARNVRIDMARFESLEALTRVGLDLDPKTQLTVERGRILRELMRQPRFVVRENTDQILALTAVASGWLDGIAPTTAARCVSAAASRLRSEAHDLCAAVDAGRELSGEWQATFEAALRHELDASRSSTVGRG